MIRKQSTRITIALIVMGAVLVGCASIERPVAELSKAEASIAQAERSGAQEYGATALDSAREKYAAAQQAAQDKEYQVALRLANEAEVDARLASAQTERGKSQAALQALDENLDTLRRETTSGKID